MNKKNIKLILPLNPEFVRTARMTTSGILSQSDVSVEEIENAKLVISEVLNKMIAKKQGKECKIEYEVEKDNVLVTFSLIGNDDEKYSFIDSEDAFSIAIIEAFADELILCENGIEEIVSLRFNLK